MSKAIHILLIDDSPNDDSYIQSFQTRARRFGMKITHFERGRKAIEELRLNPFKYKGLVLDARCIWDENKKYPDDKFLSRIVAELQSVERDLNIDFPAVVNTAYIEDFLEERELIVRRGGNIFFKSTDSEDEANRIFNFLKDKIENSEEWRYGDAFELFDKGYLDNALRKDLFAITKKLNDCNNLKHNFNPLRQILEAVYEKIKGKNTNLIPDQIFYGFGGGINLDWSWKYLSGLPIYQNRVLVIPTVSPLFPDHIISCAKLVKELSSTISHRYTENVTIYSYRCAVFALLEILVWLDEFMSKP